MTGKRRSPFCRCHRMLLIDGGLGKARVAVARSMLQALYRRMDEESEQLTALARSKRSSAREHDGN